VVDPVVVELGDVEDVIGGITVGIDNRMALIALAVVLVSVWDLD
jgi:hypothetical protein